MAYNANYVNRMLTSAYILLYSPSMSEQQPPAPRLRAKPMRGAIVSVRMTYETKVAAERAADDADVTLSKWVERLIIRALSSGESAD